MKIREKFENLDWENEIEHMIALAYLAGQEKATKAICDEHNRRMAAMRQAASKCRYFRMANNILDAAGGDIIYSEHYAGNVTAELCDEEYTLGGF